MGIVTEFKNKTYMKPTETIEKEINDVRIIGELFEEKIFDNGSKPIHARLNFVNINTRHLIGAIYLEGVTTKEKLQESVNGAEEKINEILPCL